MNFFVEGLQGSGKSTLVNRLFEKHPDYRTVREGDYSPVELSWCAYLDRARYGEILEKYPDLRAQIEGKSVAEDDRVIVCYTKVSTDNRAFYKDLEQYEIYNGRVSNDAFREITLRRFRRWNGDGMIFECSLFQNIVEDMILFRDAPDEEIMDFYRQVSGALADKPFHILYLQADDIASNINVIRKERSDGQGSEMWFPLMLHFFDESPHAKRRGLAGEAALLEHFRHRQDLELRLCREIFPGRYTVLKSKAYRDADYPFCQV
ncbi:MAG: hypothetical protein IKO07_10565 [Clostridia bacterium]|nr:hypothetical protein [Clostridia bacterium]